MIVAFNIPGAAVPKARARVTKTGHAYTPARTKTYENTVRALAKVAMCGRAPAQGPLSVSLVFFMPRPKKPQHSVPAARPDLDNLAKSVTDGMNGIVYVDDGQIVTLRAEKAYAEKGEGSVSVIVEAA